MKPCSLGANTVWTWGRGAGGERRKVDGRSGQFSARVRAVILKEEHIPPWVGLIARSTCLVTQKIVGHHVDNFQMPPWREERGIWEFEVICPMFVWPLNNSIILKRRSQFGLGNRH